MVTVTQQFALSVRHLYSTDSFYSGQKVFNLDTVANTQMCVPGESIGSFGLESAIDELAYRLNTDSIALTKETFFDERSGRITNVTLAEYHVPVNADVPPVDVIFLDISDEHTPLGGCGIGDADFADAAATLVNAVFNTTGTRIRNLPTTLDKLLAGKGQALKGALWLLLLIALGYLHFAGGNAIQLGADGLSVVGEKKQVYEGWSFLNDRKTEGFWLESPKLTRRGDYFYLTSGPPTSHMAVVARSKSPLGPWDNPPHNPPIHTYNAEETWWSVGHGTLVSTPDDRWCGVGLGLFYNPDNWLFTELKSGQLRVYNAKQTLASRAWKPGTVYLRIVNRNNRVEFSASENGRDWQRLVADVDTSGFVTNVLKGFQALRLALAAHGEGEARFASFSYL